MRSDPSSLARPIGEQFERAERSAFDTIIAFGGDGTVNGCARLAIACGAVLRIVPMGTMNLLARDLGIPLDAERAIAAMPGNRERSIDAGAVNGSLFLHSSLLGVVPRMSRLRERLRVSNTLAERVRVLPRLARSAMASPPLDLALSSDAGSSIVRSRSVAVTCNALRSDGIVSHERETLTGGELGVYASVHASPLGLLASLATGRLARDPETLDGRCHLLRIETRAGSLVVANDGETVRLRTPLEYRILPAALRVGAP